MCRSITVLSEAPGAAEYLDGGFVTYTPEQKCTALKLDEKLVEKFGPVSAEVAEMAVITRWRWNHLTESWTCRLISIVVENAASHSSALKPSASTSPRR
jgi:competence-damaged protein